MATEAEWRDPDNVSSAMLMQGVLFKLPGCYPLVSMRDGFRYKFWVYILSSWSGTLGTEPGENILKQHRRRNLFSGSLHSASVAKLLRLRSR